MIRKITYFVYFFFFLSFSIFNYKLANAGQRSQHYERILSLVESGMNVMRTKKTMTQKRQTIVNKYMSAINFEWNAKMAIGRPYLTLTPEKQKEYVKAYTEFLAYVWLPKLNYDSDSGIKIVVQKKTEVINDKDQNVTVNLITPDSKKYEAIFRVRCENNNCKILNIVAEGIDLAMSYRSQFTSYIEEHRGDATCVIDYLKQQNKINKSKADFVVRL